MNILHTINNLNTGGVEKQNCCTVISNERRIKR